MNVVRRTYEFDGIRMECKWNPNDESMKIVRQSAGPTFDRSLSILPYYD